jgi:cytosol alanyl aminopeptidase
MPAAKILRWMVFAATSLAFPAALAETPPVARLGNAVVPTRYHLELAIDPARDTFSGNVVIDVTLSEARDAIWLHGRNLQVSEVFVTDKDANRIDAAYEERDDSGVALVSLSRTAAAGPAKLHFSYSAPFNTAANALYRVESGGLPYAVTQFEPIAARQVFPGFDEPGFKVPFEISLITRHGDVAVTTTPEVSAERLGDGRVKHVFLRTRPLPTYLIAIAVGPYDVVDYGMIPPNPVRKHGLALRGIAAKGHGERMQYALKNTPGLLAVLEDYFGTPYPYEKLDLIAVPEGFGGAMENVGAITYDEYLLLMDENAPVEQRRDYTAVHAHELAHMWFGNLVTPEWWNDIWLNESFATWIMNKASHRYWPEGEFDRSTLKGALGAMSNDSLAAARQIREPIDHNDKIAGAFDGITYQKGGGVLAMLERYVGEERFQAGIRLHLARNRDGSATAEEFIASVAEGSDRSEIGAAFHSFIQQPGVPLVSVRLDCADPKNPRLDLRQARYAPLGSSIKAGDSVWKIPFCAAYTTGGTRHSTCALLGDRQQSVSLDATSCPAAVHPNADGAGYYRFTLDEAGWQSLIAGVAGLSPAEALAFGDSLDAAFRAGTIPAQQYVSGLAALAGHGAWDVAIAATQYLEAVTQIFDEVPLRTVEPAFHRIVAPRYALIGTGTDSGTELLRKDLQRFMIVIAKDKAMRKPLADQAAAVIGLNGNPDPSAAPKSEWETIFSVAVQDIGAPFFDRLLQQAIESDDAAFRQAAAGALARVEDPALVRRLQAAVLADSFKGTEMVGVVFRQMGRPASRAATYAWLRQNDKAIIGMFPETFRSAIVPALGGAFCSNELADEWQAFVKSHATLIPGYERGLAQAVEGIQLCAALKQASAASLIAAFDGYR